MSDTKIETVRSSSSGVIGRASSVARGHQLVLDSSSRPQPDALTNSEAFLAGISSCGVTLIEMSAQEAGLPVRHLEVSIEGARTAADPARFSRVSMTFKISGVTQPQAEALVETYRGR
ncbi:MAG: OsmC family protein [Candidatus Rokuibacteriota bacterium]